MGLWKSEGKSRGVSHKHTPVTICEYLWHIFSPNSTQSCCLIEIFQIICPSLCACTNCFTTYWSDLCSLSLPFIFLCFKVHWFFFFFTAQQELSHPRCSALKSIFYIERAACLQLQIPSEPWTRGLPDPSWFYRSLSLRPPAPSTSHLQLLESSANERWNN